MKKMVGYKLSWCCTNAWDYLGVLQISEIVQRVLSSAQSNAKFVAIRRQDFERLVSTQIAFKLNISKWPIIPDTHRRYQQIQEYCPQPESFARQIEEKLRSGKVPREFPAECVCKNGDFEGFGNFNNEHQHWDSQCPNRKDRVECSCDTLECKNSQRRLKQHKLLDVDVKEAISWGIDLYTRKNIFHLLHETHSTNDKHRFIETTILKAANLCGNSGYFVHRVLDFILAHSKRKCDAENDEVFFSNQDRKYAKLLKKVLLAAGLEENFDDFQEKYKTLDNKQRVAYEAFRLHSKGMGGICIK